MPRMGVRSLAGIPARDLTGFNRTNDNKENDVLHLSHSRSLTASKYLHDVYTRFMRGLSFSTPNVCLPFAPREPPRMLLNEHSSRILRNPDKSRATHSCCFTFHVNFVYFLQKKEVSSEYQNNCKLFRPRSSRAGRASSLIRFRTAGASLRKLAKALVEWIHGHILFARCIRCFYYLRTIMSSRHDRINRCD